MATLDLSKYGITGTTEIVHNPSYEQLFEEETKATPIKKNAIPEGYKANPEYIETKSKRVQLLLQPSTVGSIKKLATKKGISMNEAINEAIQEYLSKEEGK